MPTNTDQRDNPYTVKVKTEDGIHTFERVGIVDEINGVLHIGRRHRNSDGVPKTRDLAHFNTWHYWLREKTS